MHNVPPPAPTFRSKQKKTLRHRHKQEQHDDDDMLSGPANSSSRRDKRLNLFTFNICKVTVSDNSVYSPIRELFSTLFLLLSCAPQSRTHTHNPEQKEIYHNRAYPFIAHTLWHGLLQQWLDKRERSGKKKKAVQKVQHIKGKKEKRGRQQAQQSSEMIE